MFGDVSKRIGEIFTPEVQEAIWDLTGGVAGRKPGVNRARFFADAGSTWTNYFGFGGAEIPTPPVGGMTRYSTRAYRGANWRFSRGSKRAWKGFRDLFGSRFSRGRNRTREFLNFARKLRGKVVGKRAMTKEAANLSTKLAKGVGSVFKSKRSWLIGAAIAGGAMLLGSLFSGKKKEQNANNVTPPPPWATY